MTKSIPRVLFAVLLTIGASGQLPASELTLDEIIARYTDAMGGKEKIESVQTVEVSLHIKDPDFEVDGIYHAARPGKMPIDIMAEGKRVYMERFDGEKGWQWNGKEEKEEGATPTAALRQALSYPEIFSDCMRCRSAGIALS